MHPPTIRPQPLLISLFAVISLAAICITPHVAHATSPRPVTPALHAAEVEAIATRDAFVARLHAAGFACPLAPPSIVVEDVPSFGQYDDERNILRTSDWTVLQPEERAAFFKLAGLDAKEADAHALFDLGAHRWIIIHELGHWWQACNKVADDKNPYNMEYDADRVSLSYWREVDPTVVTRMMPIFEHVIALFPNPTPPGKRSFPTSTPTTSSLDPPPPTAGTSRR